MNDPMRALEHMVNLAAEGARRFGDDPARITAYIQAEIAKLPEDARAEMERGMQMVVEDPNGTTARVN